MLQLLCGYFGLYNRSIAVYVCGSEAPVLLPVNPTSSGCCGCCRLLVHEGSFNMLHSVVSHIVQHQAGRGLVAVSPRYAGRILRKFSVMWPLPEAEVTGILNAIDGLPSIDVSMEEMLEGKKQAKLAFQLEHGLQVCCE